MFNPFSMKGRLNRLKYLLIIIAFYVLAGK